jgi:putative transposase
VITWKTELDLNNKQKTLAKKHAGVRRHAWNWGLAIIQEEVEKKSKWSSAINLHKRLVAEVKSVNDWYYEVSKCSPQQALRDLVVARDRWKKKIAKFPRFKKKGIKDSFYLEGNIQIQNNQIKLPIFGWVRTYEQLPIMVAKNCVVSCRAGRWFIAFKIEAERLPIHNKPQQVVGVDLGIKVLATLSTGFQVDSPTRYKPADKKLKRLQRKLSRQVQGSKNREKTKLRIAKQHYRVASIRQDILHKLTSYLTKNHGEVVTEDLKVSNLIKKRTRVRRRTAHREMSVHNLARAIANCGFYEFKRQVAYKANWYGTIHTTMDTFYPSSKTCSNCGAIKKTLKLSERVFNCNDCGFIIDRDLNASYNLAKMAVSSTVTACGQSRLQKLRFQ